MPNDSKQSTVNSQQSTVSTPPPVFPDMDDTPPPMVLDDNLSNSSAPVEVGDVKTTDVVMPAVITPPSEPKKKFAGGKIIATILGLFLLVGGVGAGVYLVGQNQNPEEKAACSGPAYDLCRQTKGSQVCACDICGDCTRPDSPGGGGGSGSEIVSCNTAGAFQCGETPDGCGGFCISGATKTCDEMLKQECNFEPVRGASYRTAINKASCPSGYQSAWCDCGGTGVCFDRGFDGSNGTQNQCGTSETDGLCAVYASGQTSGGTGGVACGTVNTYYCPNVNYTTSGQACSKNLNSRPANFCGTIQTDTACQGFKSTYVPCTTNPPPVVTPPPTPSPSPSPTPPAITAVCQNVKAYSETWTLLTNAQLAALRPTNRVNFCVTGVTNGGSFNKARFTINGALQPETTTVRPGSTDFCQLYTIPSGTTTFNVTAQINHVTLGWK